MPVDTPNEEYSQMSPLWLRARHFIAGEHAVKGADQSYLPMLDGQDATEYQKYKSRTLFLNATARTHEGLSGMIFIKDPKVVLPDTFKEFQENIDLGGMTLYDYSRNLISEVLSVGRGGTLVEWSNEEERVKLLWYNAESVINWRYRTVKGVRKLSMVVLRENVSESSDDVLTETGMPIQDQDPFVETVKEKILVLRLIEAAEGRYEYNQEVWERQNVESQTASSKGRRKSKLKDITGKRETKWVLVERIAPTKSGATLDFIPFVFHTSRPGMMDVCRPPMDDLISLNVSHYQLSADNRHGLHFTALPTAWIAGFDTKTSYKIGSSVAWVSENTDASAAFLEFSGAGLGAIREELDRIERQMAVMGARLLEQEKRMAETAETTAMRKSGESSILTGISASSSQSLTTVLKIARWWTDGREASYSEVPDEQASIEFNSNFMLERMSGAELISFVSAWQQGGISQQTLLWNLRQGDIIPANLTDEQEVALIEQEAAKRMDALDRMTKDESGGKTGGQSDD